MNMKHIGVLACILMAVFGGGSSICSAASLPRYLQTDGKGYFDLGFAPHLRTTRIEIVSTIDPNVSGGQGILWAGTNKVMGLCAYPSSTHFTYYTMKEGSSGGDNGVALRDSCFVGDKSVHRIVMEHNAYSVDGVEMPCGWETENVVADGNAILFLNDYQAEPAVKLYSIKVWDTSTTPATLTHSFVPGTTVTLYDEVAEQDLTVRQVTAGTAFSFSLGTDVTLDEPEATTSFVYDGTAKRPIAAGANYTLHGDAEQTIPGSYTVRVAPNGGYCWADGTHDARVFSWTIEGAWNLVETDYGSSNRVTIAEKDYCILTFSNTDASGFEWTVPEDVTSFDFLAVAGGGGGGSGKKKDSYSRRGGGGGAGGVVTGRVNNATGTFTVKVGAGGAGGVAGTTTGYDGTNGGDTSISCGGVNYVVAKGGGYGAGACWTANTTAGTGSNGGAGGSGGGGSTKYKSKTSGGAVTASSVASAVTAYATFGHAGGGGNTHAYAGGGGGAGGAGISATTTSNGAGGAGLTLNISGDTCVYAAGGAGGASYAESATPAEAATGNGGVGGTHGASVGYYGETGGSGVVVIRYAVPGGETPEPEAEPDFYDWLQADGNGYIVTGYTPNLKKTRVEFVFEETSHDMGFFWMANACTQPGGSGSGYQMGVLNYGLKGSSGYELQYTHAGGEDDWAVRIGTPQAGVVQTNVVQGIDVWLNGVHGALTSSAQDVAASGPLVLFAGNWAGKYADGMKAMLKAKVYRVTVSEVDGATTNVVMNLLPVKNEEGRATLYDTVSRAFLRISGDEAAYTVGNGYPVPAEPQPEPDPTATAAPLAVAPLDGSTVDILTPTQSQFLALGTEARRALYTSQAARRNLGSWDYGFCDPQPLTLRWRGADGGNAGCCTVRVWRVQGTTETLHFMREVVGDTTTVDNFEVAADYRWEVANAFGSAGGAFTTRDETPRLLRDPDPEQKIQGIRDLGGRIGLNGRRIKQNLIFRSSRLNGPGSLDENFITDANRSWWRDTLKIKTDLDLRGDSEVGVWRTTPIPNATWQYKPGSSYSFASHPSNFKASFNLFLDAANYPFVFHCAAGQDRTGCLAFVLETLLGVDEDECLKDWEANAFRNTDVAWNHDLIDTFKAGFDSQSGATLSERIVNWVKAQGYTDAQINTFRELMLEPLPPEPLERCDYVQTDRNGSFDLGFKPNLLKTRIEIVSTVDPGTTSANAFAWAHSDENPETFYRIGYGYWPSAEHFSYYVSTETRKETDYSSGLHIPKDRPGVHTVLIGGKDFVVDGVRTPVNEQPDDHESGETMQLFVTRTDSYQYSPAVKLYGVKVWNVDGGETNLVHNFVPVRVGTGASLCDILDPSATPLAVRGTSANFTAGDDVEIAVPTCETEFVYDGTEKRPLADTDDYTVLGDVAETVPGAYEIRIVPNGGRCWADNGAHDARVISWTIAGTWNPVGTDYGSSNRVTIAEQDYCILSFTNTALTGFAWTVPEGVDAFDFLVVAGGGGGGAGQANHEGYCRTGGGGGAGGVVTGRVESAMGTFTVKVGAGGARGATYGANGAKGGDSSLTLDGINYVTAKGGGYGGGARWTANNAAGTGNPGGAGGSGGGGSSKASSLNAGGAVETPVIGAGVSTYTAFGCAGGTGYSKSYAGGGGGAGGAGGSASSSNAANGAGGAGLVLTISGLTATYACGGGTAKRGSATDGACAEAATGNGGAGGHGSSGGAGFYGESGGSGIVIIRYAVASAAPADLIQETVDAAKSGDSVLPEGIAVSEVTLAADGASFAYGENTYAKAHYVFEITADNRLVAKIDVREAAIGTFEKGTADDAFVVGTVEETVVGFSYTVIYADDLKAAAADWSVGASVPGTGGPCTISAPKSATGDRRFYRLVVTD